MKWFSKILGKGKQPPSDPIIAKCQEIVTEYGLSLNEEEWNNVLSNRDKVAASQLGGAFIHKDVFHVLCFLCLFDGMFDAGVELLQAGTYHRAIHTLEKARKLLPWPTILYTLEKAYTQSGNMDVATGLRKKALENFETRSTHLLTVVPQSVPDRDNFLRITAEMLDIKGSLALGFTGITELRDTMLREPW